MDDKTVKRVRRAASKIYKKPAILLSLPFNTKDEDDPPLDAVNLTFMCAPPLEPFLRSYLLATEKVRHGYYVDTPVVITFEWADQSKGKQTRRRFPFTNKIRWDVEFVKTTIAEAPDRKNEFRVLVDGEDVRKYLLAMRREDRIVQLRHPDICERWHWRTPTSYELFFAGEEIRNVGYDKPTRKKIHKDYKGLISEGELQIRKDLAGFQEGWGVPAEVLEQFLIEDSKQKFLGEGISYLQNIVKQNPDNLSSHNVGYDKPTYEKIFNDYKEQLITKGELRKRQHLAQFQEEWEDMEAKYIETLLDIQQEFLLEWIHLLQIIIKQDPNKLSTALLMLGAELKKEKGKTVLLNTLV